MNLGRTVPSLSPRSMFIAPIVVDARSYIRRPTHSFARQLSQVPSLFPSVALGAGDTFGLRLPLWRPRRGRRSSSFRANAGSMRTPTSGPLCYSIPVSHPASAVYLRIRLHPGMIMTVVSSGSAEYLLVYSLHLKMIKRYVLVCCVY